MEAATTQPAPTRPRPIVLTRAMAARLGVLDPVGDALGRFIRNSLGSGTAKDALSGTWLGHPVHPLLTDVVIGCWVSALIVDVAGGKRSDRAAQVLIATGLGAAGPTIASGWSDWADTSVDTEVRRVGLVHAATNATAVALHASSLVARCRGRHTKGKLLSAAGTALLGVGGYLGGHLAFAKGVGVNATAFEKGPTDWTQATTSAEVPIDGHAVATVDGVRLLLARVDGRVVALSDTCTHRGGPLHEGEFKDGCVQCPWHASVFRLVDGSVVSGPASEPQPVYEAREIEGRIEVRAASGL